MDRKSLSSSGDDKTATLRNFKRMASKEVTRNIEKWGQRMGKKDQTEDAFFDFNVDNFEKQQQNAAKLQKYSSESQ